MSETRIPLPQLLPELRLVLGEQAPGYRRLYNEVLDGRIPTAEQVRGRWTVAADAVPAIAEALAGKRRSASIPAAIAA